MFGFASGLIYLGCRICSGILVRVFGVLFVVLLSVCLGIFGRFGVDASSWGHRIHRTYDVTPGYRAKGPKGERTSRPRDHKRTPRFCFQET